MILPKFRIVPNIEGRVWALVVAGLATGAILAGLFLAHQTQLDRERNELNSLLQESQDLEARLTLAQTHRSLRIQSLARNSQDDESARRDLDFITRQADQIRGLFSAVEKITDQTGREREFGSFGEAVTKWDQLALKILDLRAEHLANAYRAKKLSPAIRSLHSELLHSWGRIQPGEPAGDAGAAFLEIAWKLLTTTDPLECRALGENRLPTALANLQTLLNGMSQTRDANTSGATELDLIRKNLDALGLMLLGDPDHPGNPGFFRFQANSLHLNQALADLIPALEAQTKTVLTRLKLMESRQGEYRRFREDSLRAANHRRLWGVALLGLVLSLMFLAMASLIAGSIGRIRRSEKESASQLALFGQRFSDIALASGDWVWETDSGGRFTFLAGNVRPILGFKPEEMLGSSFLDYLPQDEQKRLKRVFIQAARTKAPIEEVEHWVLARDGREISVATTGVPVFDDQEKVKGFRGINKEITAAIAAREDLMRAKEEAETANVQLEKAAILANQMALAAEAANAAKSQFLATMSHEIRTPMNGIIGMTNLILDTDLSEEQHGLADIIHSSAQSLLSILNDILDYSKVEAGMMELELIPYSPRDVVDDVLEMLGVKAGEKGLQLVGIVEPDVPLVTVGDPTRLRQVLINLAGNALKFTEKGSVVIHLEVQHLGQDRHDFKYSIRDTGIGIRRQDTAHLFEPFAQSDNTTTRNFGGTGLGLSISRKIVTLMNGEIGVESKPGSGSTFWFTISHASGDLASQDLDPQLARIQKVSGILQGKRGLILHDHEATRASFGRHFETLGLHLLEAASLAQARILLRDSIPRKNLDLLFVQDNHPEGSGSELLARLEGIPGQPKPRTYFLTSFSARMGAETSTPNSDGQYWTTPLTFRSLMKEDFNSPGARQISHFGHQGTALPVAMDPGELEDVRILLVDDNLVNRKVAVGLMRKIGLSVTTVTNGREAVQAWRNQSWDLILMDCMMPIMDGFEAARTIRQLEADDAHIPIIAMTASTLAEDREDCLAAGMDDFVAKPIKLDLLEAAVRRQLRRTPSPTV